MKKPFRANMGPTALAVIAAEPTVAAVQHAFDDSIVDVVSTIPPDAPDDPVVSEWPDEDRDLMEISPR